MKRNLLIALVLVLVVAIFVVIYFADKDPYSGICAKYSGYSGYICEDSTIRLEPTMTDAPTNFVDKAGNLIASCGGMISSELVKPDPKCADLYKLSCGKTDVCGLV